MNLIKRLISIVIILALAYGLFFWLSQPFRRKVSNRFAARGETYLAARQYESAYSEFKQALSYNAKNQKAKDLQKLTKETTIDLTQGLRFFKEKNKDLAKKIVEAGGNYPQAKAALQSGLTYLEQGDYQLAIIPIRIATEQDPAYPEAFDALKTAYERLAENCPKKIISSCESSFQAKARSAKTKLLALDPTRK